MKLLSKRSVASRLDVSPKTIDRMVAAGDFPAPSMTLGPKSDRWLEDVVTLWLARKTEEFTTSVKKKTT